MNTVSRSTLHLYAMHLTRDSFQQWVDYLISNASIYIVMLEDCWVCDGLPWFVTALNDNLSITQVSWSWVNPNCVIDPIFGLTSVHTLELQDVAFKEIRMSNRFLTKLTISRCRLSDALLVQLCEALKGSPDIRILNLSYNQIGDKGASTLADSLQALTSLNLNRNRIGGKGAEALVGALWHNTTLRTLHISNNDFDKGVFGDLPQYTIHLDRISPFNLAFNEINWYLKGNKGRRRAIVNETKTWLLINNKHKLVQRGSTGSSAPLSPHACINRGPKETLNRDRGKNNERREIKGLYRHTLTAMLLFNVLLGFPYGSRRV